MLLTCMPTAFVQEAETVSEDHKEEYEAEAANSACKQAIRQRGVGR